MTIHSIIRDLKYIKDNHEILDYSENELEKITEALEYIKVHAIHKRYQDIAKRSKKCKKNYKRQNKKEMN